MINASPSSQSNDNDTISTQTQQTAIGYDGLKKLRLGSNRRRSYIDHIDDDISRAEIDAKIAATEARAHTKFAQILGELKTANAEVLGEIKLTNSRMTTLSTELTVVRSEAISNRNLIIGIIIGTLVTIAIGIYGLAQWSDARMFSMIQMREMMRPAIDSGAGPTTKFPEPRPQTEPTSPLAK